MTNEVEFMINQEPFEDYLVFLKTEKGLSINTVNSYKRDINQYIDYLNKNKIRNHFR